MSIPILSTITAIIDKVIPDAKTRQEVKLELEKNKLELEKLELEEINKRLEVTKEVFGHKSVFVSGGIPCLIWAFSLAIVNNYILLPWGAAFGLDIPSIEIPGSIVGLIGTVILTLLGKKSFDENEIYLNGKLFSPSKLQVKEAVRAGDNTPVGNKKVKSLDDKE